MTMSIGAMNIPQSGAFEIDSSGNLVPAVVYGASAAMPTVPTSGGFTSAQGGGYEQLTQIYGGGGGSAQTAPSANPFDNVQPAQIMAPQYAPGSSQVLYGHYAPTGGTQSLTGAELALNGQTAPPGSGPSTTAGGAPGKAAPGKEAAGKAAADKSGGGDKPAPKAKPTADKPAATTAPKKPAVSKPIAKTVTVKSGDSLSAIGAAKGVAWREIYKLNKDVIGSNPNMILPGQVLKLP